MNKALIIAGILGAAGTGAYIIQSTPPTALDAAAPQPTITEYVPQDTLFYAGSHEPFDLRQAMSWTQGMNMNAEAAKLDEILVELEGESPALNMLVHLYRDYLSAMSNFDELSKTFGFGDKLANAVYTVGASPVIRYQAADPKAMESRVLDIEKRMGYTATPKTIENVTYRSYPFDKAESAVSGYALVIGQQDDHIILTVDTPLDDNTDLHPALGASKPGQSLAQSGQLQKIIDDYGFNTSYLAYIDHVAIVQGLTSPDTNNFGQAVKQLLAHNNAADALSAVQSEGCRKDLPTLAQAWPRTVSGYTELTGDKMVFETVVESTLTDTMAALQKLRGAIPAVYRQQPAMFAMGLGLNVDELPTFITQAWTDFIGQPYQCEFLVEAQNQMKQNNPAMLSMATAMVQSVKGVAVALVDMQFAEGPNGPMPDPQKTSGAITITAENPQSLLMMAATFVPEIGNLNLEPNGKPQQLTIPGAPVPVNVAMQGQQLTLFSGAGANAYLPADEQSANNVDPGFLYFGIDYSKYFGVIEQVLEMAEVPTQETDLQTLESLKGLDMTVDMTTDFSDKGIVFEVIGKK